MYVCVCFSGKHCKGEFFSNTDHRLLGAIHKAGTEQILIILFGMRLSEVKFVFLRIFFYLCHYFSSHFLN